MSQWSTAYQNDLSDASFLYIESGGSKDADGRTVPRELRHFPYKDASGKVDLDHLRNAIAQAPKAKLPDRVITDVQAHARRLLDEQSSKAVTKALATVRLLKGLETTNLSVSATKADAVTVPASMTVHGLTVAIDCPAGFVQTKTDDQGATLWTRQYTTPYGYIDGTAGGDGEELDVFVGPALDSTTAYWFCVCSGTGEFDEYKVVLCAESEEQARAIILAHIPKQYVMPGCCVGDVGQIKALLGQDQAAAAEAIEQVSKALDALTPRTTIEFTSGDIDTEGALTRILLTLQRLGQIGASRTVYLEADTPSGYMPITGFDGDGAAQIDDLLINGVECTATSADYEDRERDERERQLADRRSVKRLDRTRKALDSATAYKGDTVPLPPEMQTHPALTAPIIETYDPSDVGGWVGVMEPDDGAWIAFVDVNGRCLLWTQRDADGGVVGLPYEFTRHDLTHKSVRFLSATTKALSSSTPELRYVLGIVLEPEEVDGQGEIYSAEEIRKTAWLWMSDFRNIDLQHRLYVNDLVHPVESYLAPMDYAMTQDGTAYPVDQAPDGAQRILRGTWLLGAVVKDDALWEQIKAGKFTGWSINGFSKKRPI